jgi:hypothetical protein
MASLEYFGSKPANECAGMLQEKINAWTTNLEANGYLDKLRMSWAAYHGAYYTDVGTGHQITFGGTEGEITNLPVNHLRNIAQHILVMTTSTRPMMEARATNTDYKSLTQTVLANGLLDYYMREKRLERKLKDATEQAIVFGSGYIKMSWNSTSGQMFDYNEETQTPIYEGDVEFINLSAFDVIQDNSKESGDIQHDHDWVVTRSWKNRYDLAAKYPELADEILNMPTKSETYRFRFSGVGNNQTDDVAVYEFYHRRTECLPDGRYMLFLADNVILYDGPMPYRNLPVYRIAPSDIIGTPYGYTSIFDLIPLQEGLNSLFSTVMSNQSAFGVQNIIVPRGADISIGELAGSLNVIECNMQVGKPEPLNLCSTPPEVFNFIKMLTSEMETLSGVNSVTRGNPEASLKSGNALALVQSMAIQFMSGLQASYVQLVEDIGTGLLTMLRDFAAVPRVAAILGKNNRSYMQEFKGDDLEYVNRVVVDIGNPLARTTAGRVQMAEQLLQMGAIKDANEYFTVIDTGTLGVMTEGPQSQQLCIRGENEQLMAGKPAQAILTDQHKEHIMGHADVLSDPSLRLDQNLVKVVTDHIQQHINLLHTTDPNLLSLLGQQPLAPPTQPPNTNVPSPQAPQPNGGARPPQGGPAAVPPANPGNPPMPGPAGGPMTAQGAPAPHLPAMPKVPASALPNPALQQQAMGNVNMRK